MIISNVSSFSAKQIEEFKTATDVLIYNCPGLTGEIPELPSATNVRIETALMSNGNN